MVSKARHVVEKQFQNTKKRTNVNSGPSRRGPLFFEHEYTFVQIKTVSSPVTFHMRGRAWLICHL
jgi:hypothetical protein